MANRRRSRYVPWADILDLLALLAWALVLLKYWLTGQLNILLHPDYMWLSNAASLFLLLVVFLRSFRLVQSTRAIPAAIANPRHFTLLPPSFSSLILLAVAVFGLTYTPRPFASDTALQRGITDTLTMTRSQPRQFRLDNQPEDRSVVDWVRTINVYPEPDAYTDQAVDVSGFVIYPPDWPDNYLMVSRFVLTCCAADAYPVGLPVKLSGDRAAYAPDSWIDVNGKMITETLADRRQVVIESTSLTEIPEPENPYEY
ncbi:MAG: TIGR03943 family protein [Leptolyngbyaceae cyanobacterium SM1_1_3]|nr:TIGR03943 family protein [Leptolyngbyaceae cyanobacterium SM1_1_3]NJN01410.1 TIGR03943 family protein [Leptolyngbyaceae cyanobacterium RM1_1_2]NJO09578.1 TIGR03943 family protein [Leptolyngbyaceae cyanobacterium SL_1_1]